MSASRPSVSSDPKPFSDAIAIVGIGCRYPGGANTPDAFWQMIREGVDAVTEVPPSRWDAKAIYDPDPTARNKTNTRWGGFLEQVDQFDPQFFGIAPREVATMDPQQRLLLEVAWETLEDAGQIPEQLRGSKTGTFIGIGTHDYSIMLWQQPVNDPYATTGTGNCIAANRLSYIFDFKGPSLAVDTACSSSLVAVHLACQSIWSGESDMAIAGGANVLLLPTVTAGFSKGGFMSSEGRCKSFDATADGYVRSEGAGLVLLKPLAQAQADGDSIYAVIRGSAVNQDGFSKGMAAPSAQAQAEVLKAAYRQAAVAPSKVTYVEAHGTGTKLGDPVEAQALGEVLAKGRSRKQACAIGSVKTNIGHTETAAGVAGLIKAALVLKYREIPPSLHFEQPNPAIDFEKLRLRVQTEAVSIEETSEPIFVGVNSFGFGGTNAHVVLSSVEQAAAIARPTQQAHHLLALSAKSEKALEALAQRYLRLLKQSEVDLAALCAAASATRSHFSHRLAVVTSSIQQLQSQLQDWLSGETEVAGVVSSRSTNAQPDGVAFLCTGQGSQFVGMGLELYETQPVFRKALDRCAKKLKREEVPLLEVLYGASSKKRNRKSSKQSSSQYSLQDTVYTQPVLFAFEYALAQLWQSWGVEPAIAMGHSLGEYVAACLAGVFSLKDGLKLVAARGRLMQALPKEGAMLSVMAAVEQCEAAIEKTKGVVDIAAVNGPQSTVLSGNEGAIAQVEKILEQQDIQHKRLQVSHAFHSAKMEPMLKAFRKVAKSVSFRPPKLPMVSMLTGQMATAEVATAEYWVRHVRQPVRFSEAIATLHQQNIARCFLEIGAKPILLGMGRSCLSASGSSADAQWLASLRPAYSDRQSMLLSLASRYVQSAAAGKQIDWQSAIPKPEGESVTLPTYPFQRQRYWWDEAAIPSMTPKSSVPARTPTGHLLLGDRLPLAGTFEQRFQQSLSLEAVGYLRDHQVLEKVVLPGAAYLEMAIALARRWQKTDAITLSNVSIERPLLLSNNSLLQTVLAPQSADEQAKQSAQVQIFSSAGGESDFVRHAVAIASKEVSTAKFPSLLDSQSALLSSPANVERYYQSLSQQGLNYGSSFRTIQQLWQQDGRSLSQIRLAQGDTAEAYGIHPALLDGCFQTIGMAVQHKSTTGTYLPASVDTLSFFRPLGASGWCSVQLQPDAYRNGRNGHQNGGQKGTVSALLKADLCIWNESGELCAALTGMTLKYVSDISLSKLFSDRTSPKEKEKPAVVPLKVSQDWLYGLAWQTDSSQRARAEETAQNWIIFADAPPAGGRSAGMQIAQHLKRANPISSTKQRAFSIFPAEDYQAALEQNTYRLNPDREKDFEQLITDLTPFLIDEKGKLSCQILFAWSLDSGHRRYEGDGVKDSLKGQSRLCGSIMRLVKALSQFPALSAKLWTITQAAQAVDGPHSVNFQQAPLWGMVRTLRLEHPSLNCVCLDLDPSERLENLTPETLDLVVEDLCAPSLEEQIAYRQQTRWVARLLPLSDATDLLQLPETAAFRLALSNYGVLDNLELVPAERRSPQAGEVEIQVKASGLNFRDVLNALGMLQSVLEKMGFAKASEIPFGGECAGVVTAVGAGVEHLSVGDAVIAAQAVGSLRQFVTVPAQFVVPKPQSMSFAEAATVPTAFLTAYYGLVCCAQLKAGDRVLIHSAAGGVGQAAVQIAQHIGAEIFATASPPKWDFLREMGVSQISNSRTLDFAKQVLAATDGKGVDVVFNSLNGEFIDKNADVLAPEGRFVEIGKIGIWDAEKMRSVRADIAYFPFDLLEVSTAEPQQIAQMLAHLMTQFESGNLRALPKTVFPIESSPEAFRYMAQARHQGKVVLTLPSVPHQQSAIRPNATYLISGGLGAIGLEVAEWLVRQGAKNLLLLGRRSPTPKAAKKLDQLKRSASVQTIQADISNASDLQSVLSSLCAHSLPPLKGIFHLAGVLEDGLLVNQSWNSFEAVMAPKLLGAWNLHHQTQSMDLDYFVCFSSITSLVGSLGQSNYAAANAFLDALAHHRHSLGLPALSLNWGPWGDVGMVSKLDERSRARVEQQGLSPISTDRGLKLMAQAMEQPRAQLGVFAVDWARFLSVGDRPNGQKSALFEAVKPTEENKPQPVVAKAEVLEQLAQLPGGDRTPFLATYLQTQLAKVMGFTAPDAINPSEQFGDLGMDSLMAVEFSNRLQANLNHPIPQTLAFDYPTINALAAHLVREIAPAPTEVQKQDAASAPEKSKISPAAAQPISNADKKPTIKPTQIEVHNGDRPQIQQPTYMPPPEYYQFAKMPDYLRLRQDLDRVEVLNNPFFTVHEGIARDTTQIEGRSLVNYASYNYLGLSGDSRVNEAAQRAIAQYGTSVSASRVVSGERPVHQQLEKELAAFLGTEDCITYIGGHATNVTTIGHLFQEKDLILYDALSHNSIREGCNLAGAKAMEFPHNDWQTLDQLLREHRRHYEKVLIAIEGAYSTDGNLSPLPEFVAVKEAHKALLLVDEAHSIGVLGDRGRGVGEHFGIAANRVDMWMGTLSKSFASCGGYIAGCSELVEYLKYTAPGFVFSVGMAPANAAAALAALAIIKQEPERVATVQERSRQFLTLAKENGLNTGLSHDSPVIPIIVGEPRKAVQLSHTLFQQGINVQPMVYPSVPYNAARLRFFLSCLHSEEQIRKTIQVLADELMIMSAAASL